MSNWFWGYFVSPEELVPIFKDAGGILSSTAEIQDIQAELEARRSIFKYLMPGRIQVIITKLDEVFGFTFAIGLDDMELKDFNKRLRRRCWDMFLRDPDRFLYTDDPNVYTLERDGVVHDLKYLDDLECNETADWYYLEMCYGRLRKKAVKEQAEFEAQAQPEVVSTST